MPSTLPLFPLGSVLFPGVVMPLRVFEPRFRQLVEDLQALPEGTDRRFGVVAIRDGREVGEDNVRSLYEYGCTAQISAADAADDGSYALVTTGVERFRVLAVDLAGGPYPTAEVELLTDVPGEDAEALRTPATAQFLGYQRALSGLRGVRLGPLPQLPDDATVLSYLIAATMILDVREKHSLLAAADAATRLRREQALLRRETLLIQELSSLPAVDLLKRD
jgi:Lon protease-like protein